MVFFTNDVFSNPSQDVIQNRLSRNATGKANKFFADCFRIKIRVEGFLEMEIITHVY